MRRDPESAASALSRGAPGGVVDCTCRHLKTAVLVTVVVAAAAIGIQPVRSSAPRTAAALVAQDPFWQADLIVNRAAESGGRAYNDGHARGELPRFVWAGFSLPSSGSATLSISGDKNVAAGTYTMTVKGTSGGTVRSIDATLVV